MSMTALTDKLRKECEKRGIKVETVIIKIEEHYSHWTKGEKKQFRNALRGFEYPIGGHYIERRQLPRNHPARTEGYNHTDITSAFLEQLDEAKKRTARSTLRFD